MEQWWRKVIVISILVLEFLISCFIAPEGRGTAWGPFFLFILGDIFVLAIIGYIINEEKPNENISSEPPVPVIKTLSIEQLAQKAYSGDKAAWRELVERFKEIEAAKPLKPEMTMAEIAQLSMKGVEVDMDKIKIKEG